ncbi:MAG: sulfatase [Methanobacteriota archaeon]
MTGKTEYFHKNIIAGLIVGIILGSLIGLYHAFRHVSANEYLGYGFYNIALDNTVKSINQYTFYFLLISVFVSISLGFVKIRNNIILTVLTILYVFLGYKLNKTSWYPDFLTIKAVAVNTLVTLSWLLILAKKRGTESSERQVAATNKMAWAAITIIIVLNALLILNNQILDGKIEDKPNVILISIDALAANHVGLYGYKENTTPNLDAYAQNAIVFKNHITNAPWTLPSHAAMLSSQYPHVIGVEKRRHKIPYSTNMLAEILKETGYKTKGIISFAFVEPMYGFDQGFDSYDISNSFYKGEYRDKYYKSSPDITGKAISFMEKNKDKNFFLFLHYFDVHYAYNPPPPYDKMFNSSEDNAVNKYDEEIAYTDHYIWELLKWLDESGLADKTMVIVTADHGDAFNQHNLTGHENVVYEEVLHVPLIIKLPSVVQEAGVIPYQTQMIDIAPTILDVLEIPIPSYFEGESLMPLARGESTEGRKYVFSRTVSQDFWREAVRTPKYKLIHIYEPLNASEEDGVRVHSYELYDLEADPGEKTNLADEFPGVVEELRVVLGEWSARGGVLEPEVLELSVEAKKRLEDLGYLYA